MLPARHNEEIDGFRWRSHEVTRIEGFSDAVFGFAITLLIVSLEVPKTSTELLATMRGFGAFVITFLMLASLWYAQHTFFRRYGLEDRITVLLNLVLLFTVLFFVYPLKFLFTAVVTNLLMRRLGSGAATIDTVILPEHRGLVFVIFGLGFTAVFAVFTLLYRHAYKHRDLLGLNEFEIYETRYTMRRMVLACGVGVSYFAIAGMEAMPHHTPGQKRLVVVTSIAILIVLAMLIVTMLRARLARRKVVHDWKTSRQFGETAVDQSTQ